MARAFLPRMAPGRRRDAPDLAQGCAPPGRKDAAGDGEKRDSAKRAERAAGATRRQGWRHSKQDKATANRTLRRRPGAGARPRDCEGNKARLEANGLVQPAGVTHGIRGGWGGDPGHEERARAGGAHARPRRRPRLDGLPERLAGKGYPRAAIAPAQRAVRALVC